ILVGYSLGLTFYIGNRIPTPAFYAMHDTRTPVTTGMLAVAVNIVASVLLMGRFGATGLALATALASASNFLLLFTRLRGRIGLLGGRRLLLAAARVALACLPMAVWGVLSQGWWDVLAVPGAARKAVLLTSEIAVAVILFGATAAALRCEEVGWALAAIRGRGKRTPGSAPSS
ncbi:MAG: lipid II flippase MurJ, partial [candidate division NC10 bacterium]